MNRIEISVLKPDAALHAFARTWQVAEAGHAVTPRLAFGSLRELFSAITEKRLDLLRHLAIYEGLNVRQLAKSLERDYKNVHTMKSSSMRAFGMLHDQSVSPRLFTKNNPVNSEHPVNLVLLAVHCFNNFSARSVS